MGKNILTGQLYTKSVTFTGVEMSEMSQTFSTVLPLLPTGFYYEVPKIIREFTPGTVSMVMDENFEGGTGFYYADEEAGDIILYGLLSGVGADESALTAKRVSIKYPTTMISDAEPEIAVGNTPLAMLGKAIVFGNNSDNEMYSAGNGTFHFILEYCVRRFGSSEQTLISIEGLD